MSPRAPKGMKQRRFEWKVIKIPYSSVQFILLLIVIVGGGALAYLYRDRLPLKRLRAPAVIRTLLGWTGILPGGGGSADQSEAEVIERRYATLSYIGGEVKIQRANEFDWLAAEKKMKLMTGDRVRTFGGARAEVLFDDGSVLKIKPDSLIIIGDLMENLKTKQRQSSVKLMVSSIEADIKKSVVEGSRFKLEMPTAVAEMGRAKVSVDVGPTQESRLKVYSGQVAVDTGQKRIAVGDASQVSIGAGREISAVSQLLASPRISTPQNLSRFMVSDAARLSVPLHWDQVPRAHSYRVQVDTDRRFLSPAIDAADLRSPEYRLSGLSAGVYYTRVSAWDAAGQEGGFSEPLVFMVIVDRLPPDVTVQKFVASRAPGGYDIYVEGSTEPTVVLTLAGRTMVVDEEGRFSASLRGISLREKEVSLVARDAVGNSRVVALKVSGG